VIPPGETPRVDPARPSPRGRGAATVVLLSLALCASAQGPSDQQPVIPVFEEPLHRLVLERPPVRVLDVQVLPGTTSLYHLHTDPIFLTRDAE